MRVLLSFCLYLGAFLGAAAQAAPANSTMNSLFERVADIRTNGFVTSELSQAFCADPQAYAQEREKLADQLRVLRAEEAQLVKDHAAAVDAWPNRAKSNLKGHLLRKGYSVLLLAQRLSFVDRAILISCP